MYVPAIGRAPRRLLKEAESEASQALASGQAELVDKQTVLAYLREFGPLLELGGPAEQRTVLKPLVSGWESWAMARRSPIPFRERQRSWPLRRFRRWSCLVARFKRQVLHLGFGIARKCPPRGRSVGNLNTLKLVDGLKPPHAAALARPVSVAASTAPLDTIRVVAIAV